MAAQVNQLRETLLADCSYLGGISEWAAGTLHNVRNGLSPINVAAWKTKSLFESPWLTSFKTALEQLQSSAITAERREKLAAYVLSRASELLDYAEQAKLASQEVMSASKSVEDMVSGYEQFCRKGVKHEPIDLLPFIRDIAKTTVASRAMDVQLILPDTSITINSNKTILYQILSNLFVNALDAMESSSRQKSIWVDWDEADGERGGLRLSISDNGEGIAPSILESIFDRGFSTRQHKIGGLGLHWCRCAIKELGGTLEAASDGPGTGAKLVLHLPASATPAFALKAAA
jgi:C4-dicarboxylate-specific signal transduction histidine kinase